VKQGAEPPPAPTGRPITLKEAQDGATVRAKEGQDLIVRLAENPSAGYRWHVESVSRTLGQPEKTFEGPGASGPVGAGGTAVLTWKTAGGPSKVGSHAVKLKYSRGESGAASKTFSFTLNIVANTEEDPPELACPPEEMRTINCMPPTTSPYCRGDFRSWAQDNCDVSYLD
jgi:predicted secreted protein